MRTIFPGNHTYKMLFDYDLSNALYNPVDENEIIADVHARETPAKKALVKLYKGKIVEKVFVDYPWKSANDMNVYPEEDELLIAYYQTPIIEVRKLSSLELKRKIKIENVNTVASASYDSRGNVVYVGDNGVYRIRDDGSTELLLKVNQGLSIDCQRSPFGQNCAVVSHKDHQILVFAEWGEIMSRIYFPFPGGVRYTPDERLIISSGKVDKHVQLTVILGATHLRPDNGWSGYLHDYSTLPSNRADSVNLDKYLFQWYLGAFEVKAPLPKFKPYLVKLSDRAKDDYLKLNDYNSFTPLPVFHECDIILIANSNVEAIVEAKKMSYVFYGTINDWFLFDTFNNNKYKLRTPGLYRFKVKGEVEEAYAICKPK
ncbi:hypothetical protein BFU36_08365 [Sulfolobus sp. A20]|uniref:hypothetical protein n=1 Tax=Sulfolobaceae TaxID=118883 RepID=UPI000845D30B|nr:MULTISPECIES: hypothetical protein [unclassified Sulfolobus]AOL16715.1 hypothetical protein BFU36_08365 [Sulfolobus sp. A20]TRM89583.1 hypothetical protein DJ529_01635 [Sulfolobus sp. C3]